MSDKFKKLFCALFRHSNIETCCFGYIYCARCGQQKGDTIAGAYKNADCVGQECACDECIKNLAKLTWVDLFLVGFPEWKKDVQGYRKQKEENKKAFREWMDKLEKVGR